MARLNLVVSVILTFIISFGPNAVISAESETQDHKEVPTNEDDPSWYRLPEYVLPEKYELWIFSQLAVNNFTYEGRVKIDLRVLAKTKFLMINVVGLEIDREMSEVRAIVDGTTSGVNVPIVKQELNIKRQMYIISFVDDILPGQYVLSLFFVGQVLDDLNGFYRSLYESAGNTRWLGVTQFSSIFARKAFPCFDEPYMKAAYRLHIGHYTNETVTSNTAPELIQEIKPGYFLTTLAETPPMPTYLVGWAIHDFTFTKANNSTSFGLWTRENMVDQGFAFLNACPKIYEALDNWIRVKNPITKMDQIAVPDFYWSAMENWGMVTFRESVILWESGVTPAVKIRNGLSTVAHEYAHTWFGNLVTPKFWNVAWLKEGFATFFGHYILDVVHEDWKMMDSFVVEVLQQALLHDSVRHNRTMNGKAVGSPDSIPACMDFVTYKKGASIIRMVYYLVGDSAFQRGLQSYVASLANKFAVPSDFYEHLQRFADQMNPLKESIQLSDVVESWANQPGYPVVSVIRNYSTGITEIRQEKFHLNKSRHNDGIENSRWWVPINFATVESRPISKKATIWIRPPNNSILVSTVQPIETIICNIDQAYYYRVNYDQENWQRLINHLMSVNFETIGPTNRASLLDDSYNLARAGYIDYSIPLDLSRYLIHEIDYEPWVAAITAFDFLNIMLSGLPDVKTAFQAHIKRIIQPIYENLTFHQGPSDQMRTRLLRNIILSTACSMNNAHCLMVANSLFKEWLVDSDKRINPDSKSTVYCAGIRSASSKDWHEVLRKLLHTELHTEQELLIAGLGCTNNSTLIREFLNYSLYDGPEIRKQYRLTLFDAILRGNLENLEHVITFVDENLRKIIALRDTSFLLNIFEAVKKRIVLEDQLHKFKSLVERSAELIGSSIGNARKAIEFAEDNVSWIRSYLPQIEKWLNK